MKVVHIVLCCNAYKDNWNYQENCIPKYNKLAGHDVTVITIKETFDYQSGKYYLEPRDKYYDNNGVKIIRLKKIISQNSKLLYKLRIYNGLFNSLIEEKPNCIFIHGVQFVDIYKIIKYIKINKCKIVVDCHEDFNNSAMNWFSRWIIHGILWKICAKLIQPYASVFWGTLPIRCKFLHEVYGIPSNKIKLLVMGAEDEKVEQALDETSIETLKIKYGFKKNDFIVLSAGKLNNTKKEILNLMICINELNYSNLKFLFVGSVDNTLKNKFNDLLTEKVLNAGWQDSLSLYKHMAIADLIVFPGSHSVLWEQAVALGKPCLFKEYKGIDHIDLGGNCLFLKKNTKEEIKSIIKKLYNNRNELYKMHLSAKYKGKNVFSYINISKKSINV